jgi:hypothetical protein
VNEASGPTLRTRLAIDAKGLSNEDSIRPRRRTSQRIAHHENKRDKTASEDFFDRGNAACFAKSDVDDHQIWAPMRSGGHHIGEIALHGADRVAETLERFRKQSADDCVVFYDQSA